MNDTHMQTRTEQNNFRNEQCKWEYSSLMVYINPECVCSLKISINNTYVPGLFFFYTGLEPGLLTASTSSTRQSNKQPLRLSDLIFF